MASSTRDFLMELGTEELPPTSLKSLSGALQEHLLEQLTQLELAFGEVRAFASPRRLAVLVKDLPSATPQKSVTLWGPPVAVAYDKSGEPTKAALAFAKKNNVDLQTLASASDGKVEKVYITTTAGGETVASLMPQLIQQALAELPIAKRMRWGAGRDEFVRPVHWLLMLWGEDVIDCSILGATADRLTYGHRFHCNRALSVPNPNAYAELLATQGWVVADLAERRERVRSQVTQLGQSLGGTAVIDEDLLDEVTALVEWPAALAGQFDKDFLRVPPEALISSMKEHQKYFHLVDGDGGLLPHFITVSNIDSRDPAQVVAGNEKVIRPRLADAAFFYETDQQTTLESKREKLRSVVFQAKLGSLYDKTERVALLAEGIAQKLGVDSDLALRAGRLSKADLVSAMVYEFADMQGIAGYYYAKHDGEHGEVAQALNEQYQPRFARDSLPDTTSGTVLALADRLDTLAGIFGIGQVPTGSKDPFGLRRASLGVLRLLIEKQLDLDLRDLLTKAVDLYPSLPKGSESVELALNYMLERLRAWYEDAGVPVAVYQAVAARNLSEPLDINNRVYAVTAFYQLPEAQALAEANKRVSNILAKRETLPANQVQAELLQADAEKGLHDLLSRLKGQVSPMLAQRQYREALTALAQLREPVDRFFTEVMVMTEDEAVRDNRLALLQQLRNLFLEVADISYLTVTQ